MNEIQAKKQDEMVELLLADILDDVDCSPSTLSTRNRRMGELVKELGSEGCKIVGQRVREELSRTTHYASGAPYVNEEPTFDVDQS